MDEVTGCISSRPLIFIHTVVFVSGWRVTCFVPATDKDNFMVVETFGGGVHVLASEAHW